MKIESKTGRNKKNKITRRIKYKMIDLNGILLYRKKYQY
jgi:hypothetical protein